jgi:hypothetical protein
MTSIKEGGGKDTDINLVCNNNLQNIKNQYMTQNLPDENSKRFIAVLNKKIESGHIMNALGHMTAGLVGGHEKIDEMCFLQYNDKNEGVHPNISHFPFIILKADNSNKIRTVRNECIARKIPFSDFTNTMTIGTTQEQMDATKAVNEQDLEYYGIVMFGNTEELQEFTGKFSLYQ